MSDVALPHLVDLLGPDRRPWWKRIFFKRRFPEFKPQFIYSDLCGFTEIVTEDTSIIWEFWRGTESLGHAVEVGHSFDGRLVGMRIWDDVRKPRSY